MAQRTIQIADKPTLDVVNNKCDAILSAVSPDAGTNLNKVYVFILDTVHDEIRIEYGAADKYAHRIQT